MFRRPVSSSTLIIIGGAIGGEMRLLGDLALSAKAAFSYLNYGTPVVQGIDLRKDIKVGFDTVFVLDQRRSGVRVCESA